MSGGSYDYFYSKLHDMAQDIRARGGCSAASPAERKAFAAHLVKCAEACRAIEWNDSGDGDVREAQLIRECIAPGATLAQAISDAKDAMDSLRAEIQLAEERT